jgi:diguanylate cyclase (GGDEF)-like protein
VLGPRLDERLSVLIVEDEENIGIMLRDLIRKSLDVSLARDVDEAMEQLEARLFDIALVDDRLPAAEGVELLATIRSRWPHTVRLLMSGWADPDRLLKAINEGQVFGFLEKPIAPDRLLATLSQSIQMRTIMRERDEAQQMLQRQARSLEYLVGERTRQLEERNRQLEVLATRDPLTGLFNRRYMEHRLEEELARLKRYGTPYSVVLVDVDHFKAVNDTLGHAAGDHVLVQVASSLKNNVRAVDLVARFGGEEFIVLLPNTDGEPAELTANRLRRKVASLTTPLLEDLERKAITVSAGVSAGVKGDATWKVCIERADAALYEAKDAGRNCCKRRDG